MLSLFDSRMESYSEIELDTFYLKYGDSSYASFVCSESYIIPSPDYDMIQVLDLSDPSTLVHQRIYSSPKLESLNPVKIDEECFIFSKDSKNPTILY